MAGWEQNRIPEWTHMCKTSETRNLCWNGNMLCETRVGVGSRLSPLVKQWLQNSQNVWNSNIHCLPKQIKGSLCAHVWGPCLWGEKVDAKRSAFSNAADHLEPLLKVVVSYTRFSPKSHTLFWKWGAPLKDWAAFLKVKFMVAPRFQQVAARPSLFLK